MSCPLNRISTVRRRHDAGYHAPEGGLATAGFADKADDLTALDGHADAIDSMYGFIALRKTQSACDRTGEPCNGVITGPKPFRNLAQLNEGFAHWDWPIG